MNREASLPTNYPREGGSPVYATPLQSEGPGDFYPPVCLKSHWDPTMILTRTLPEQYVPQPLDFRPWTRICMEYTTAGPAEAAPAVAPAAVMPSGGQFYPPGRYAAAIDNESQLRRLDRPLGLCEGNQWEPPLQSDMYVDKALVPRKMNWGEQARVQELAYPRALLRSGPYDCRAAEDEKNIRLTSDFLFNNATKQDKYKTLNADGTRPAAATAPLKAAPELMRPDLTFNAGRPAWQGSEKEKYDVRTYEKGAAVARADLVANARTPAEQKEAADKVQQTAEGKGRVVGVMASYAFPGQGGGY